MGKNNFFELVWDALNESAPDEKTKKTYALWERFEAGEFEDFDGGEPTFQEKPSYSSFCEIKHPSKVEKRRNLDTDEGKARFLHAITHIEYSAIDLALDACHSFRGLPKEFYRDWLEVAKEECDHFLMLISLLTKAGGKYGDYPVHASLFEACRKSPTLLKRMAAIPRWLEAGGLDANSKMRARIERAGGELSQEVLSALDIILRDEIDHVTKGTKWFLYACEKEGVSPEAYFDIVESVLPNSVKQKEDINIEARLKAGFRCEEIKKLTTKETKC